MSDMPLLDWTPKGATIDLARDKERLGAQMQRVHDFVVGRGWLTLAQISSGAQAPQASVSARLRDLRKMGFEVERQFCGGGLHRYRVTAPSSRGWRG